MQAALPASPTRPLRSALTRGDRHVVRAIAEAMFAEAGEVDASRLDAHVDEVDAFLGVTSKAIRVGLRLALLVVRLSPVLLFFRFRLLDQLSVEERVVVLSRLERSSLANLSLAFIGWRTVMTLLFYEDPAELARLGYPGHERHRYKRRLLVAPPAIESGVRLKETDAPDVPDEAEAAPASGREVA